MRNQPNHPEVSPLFTANPIADVSLSIQPSAVPLGPFPPRRCSRLSVTASLSLCPRRPARRPRPPSSRPQCLFAAALANPNRGRPVFTLNPPLGESVLGSNRIKRPGVGQLFNPLASPASVSRLTRSRPPPPPILSLSRVINGKYTLDCTGSAFPPLKRQV